MDGLIYKPLRVCGVINAPSSKSYAQRALLANYLSASSGRVLNSGSSDDVAALQSALQSLRLGSSELSIGESGLSCRLLVPFLATLGRRMSIKGEGSILSRSLFDMVTDLRGMGVDVIDNNGRLPLEVFGSLNGGEYFVDGSGGSQFLSGLLFSLPLCDHDSVIRVSNLKSKPYVDVTLSVLRMYGIFVDHDGYEIFRIGGRQRYIAVDYVVEGDWSSASSLLVLGAVGGAVTIKGLNRRSLQADVALLGVLVQVGADVQWSGDTVCVSKCKLSNFDFDATDCPDLFCALVALAASCDGVSVISGVDRLQNKESDRAFALKSEFGKMGINIHIEDNKMYVHGGELIGAEVDSHNDHRIAMSLAVAALNASGVTTIKNRECVSKSYREFFNDLKKITCYE